MLNGFTMLPSRTNIPPLGGGGNAGYPHNLLVNDEHLSAAALIQISLHILFTSITAVITIACHNQSINAINVDQCTPYGVIPLGGCEIRIIPASGFPYCDTHMIHVW